MSAASPAPDGMVPGEILYGDGPITIGDGLPVTRIEVTNTGDRPIQVGSHYHFAECNPALGFDRRAAHGQRLAIPAGTAVRFEPGIERMVELVPIGGRRVIAGLRGTVAGPLDGTVAGPLDGTVAGPLDSEEEG